ncbi:FecR family protein [Chitinophaga filiformis]|uniref:FecR domain-containing protein n=1 Tax=Chitinophaga filiformis TaxID=104663 RepID=A0ABY4I0X2_CHIFI|nr:FecR domain-containing protein [Chitinophaga filiformis]UPK69739.1 FecR domain-containing protein [Chitinophaga filiformis]
MDEEQITQLVIDELLGNITPEDAAMLNELVQEDATAAALRLEIIRLLTEGDMQGALDEKIPIERALTKLENQKNKTKKRSFRGPGTVIIAFIVLATIFLFYKQQQQADISKKSVDLQAAIYKYPVLMFGDGSFIRMDQINDNKISNLSSGPLRNTAYIHGSIHQFEKATLITARGENYQVVLSDGSTLYAGPKTSITFFLGNTAPRREIAISGQAFIDVTHDPQRPFIVDLPHDGKVKVLGTSFNVNTEEQGGIQVALKEGSVQVENGQDSTRLEPGFAASWKKGSRICTTRFNEDTVSFWRQGRYLCSKATLRDLANVMEHCYHYPVSIDVPAEVDTSRFVDRELVRGNSIETFLNSGVVFPSHSKFIFYFDKDSTLHISLNHGPSTNHR